MEYQDYELRENECLEKNLSEAQARLPSRRQEFRHSKEFTNLTLLTTIVCLSNVVARKGKRRKRRNLQSES